ncbi:MAG TPA: S8 family serine peptidase, partial [Candidatus Dormibacteraeota bacterium]|nr:S8 family serine peptidase [Candidatus Dormibacteraeota bacterium]
MGFWRLSQPGVVARLLTGVLGSGLLLLAGSAPVSAHAMTPAGYTDAGAGPCPCYGPNELRDAYDVPSDLNGSGRTIVIISAFRSPVVQGDLDAFSAHFGMASASVQVVVMEGTPAFNPMNPTQLNWVGEQSADVEWAHAIAPGAGIVVVEAKSQADQDILDATKYAIANNLGDVYSMSFGEAESCQSHAFFADQHATFGLASSQGVTLVAASGDRGSAQ